MSFCKPSRTVLAIAVIAALQVSLPTYAQEAQPQQADPQQEPSAAPVAQSPVALDAITVTAQKRTQNNQDVPATINVLNAQALGDAGVRDIKDMQVLVPGLTVTSTTSEVSTTARIRGVGTVGDNPGLESSVGVVIDGVYRPRNGVGFGDLGEISQIEILKGPQGTLWGKNTTAGVININTAAPEYDFGLGSEISIGSYGLVRAAASVTGALGGSDKFAGRLFVAKGQRDGFLDIVNTGNGPRTRQDDGNQDYETARGQLLFEPTEDLTFRLIGDYTSRDENCCTAVQLFVGTDASIGPTRASAVNNALPGSIPLDPDPFARESYANRDSRQSIEEKGVSLQADWNINPDLTFTSITAWRDWDAINGLDADFTAADILYRPSDGGNRLEFKQFSQELRLAGQTGRWNWLVGGFYADEDVTSRNQLRTGVDHPAFWNGVSSFLSFFYPGLLNPGLGSDDLHEQSGKSTALFTDHSFQITDRLTLGLGARYTRDEKTLTSDYTTTSFIDAFGNAIGSCARGMTFFDPVGRVGCLNHTNEFFDTLGVVRQEQDDARWSGSARISYEFAEDVMGYASWARGYKSGGYNLDRSSYIKPGSAETLRSVYVPNPDTSFAPETVEAFEIGLKSQWFDNTLRLNVSAFQQEYENFQLNTFAGTAFVVESLPGLTSRGGEVELQWRTPLQGLRLDGGVTYADTRIDEFTAADLSVPGRFATSLFRLPGARAPFAPLWSASLAATYEHPIGNDWLFRANVSGKYNSDYNTGSDLHPIKAQKAFSVFNGRIGFASQDDRLAIELWGMNLLDKDYIQVGFNGPAQVDEADDGISVYNAFLGAPRTYGITFRAKFY